MASQKQRRRRAKEKRHEYELVEIDAEGNETVLSATDLRPSEAAPKSKGARQQTTSRRGVPQPPTWSRVGKRGLIFAPIFFLTVMLLGGGEITIAGAIVQTLFLLAIFVPFSYFMDRVMWRSHQKRLERSGRAPS